MGRLSIGGTSEHVDISGTSTTTPPNGGTPTTFPGGLLALPTNIGSYSHGGFTVVPEIQFKLGYDITPCLRATIGYDAIYWSRVARPGEQIDTFVNTSQASNQPLVGTPGPRFAFHETDLWAHGLSFGGEWRF
jgi:Putative beta barrel porin-7 (BBP7)